MRYMTILEEFKATKVGDRIKVWGGAIWIRDLHDFREPDHPYKMSRYYTMSDLLKAKCKIIK